MKPGSGSRLAVILAILLLGSFLFAQTAPRITQLFSSTTIGRLLIQTPGSPWVQTATIGPGLRLNPNLGNYELSTTDNLIEQVVVCRNANGECVLPVLPAPNTLIKVYRNGLLMELTEDYTWDSANRKVSLSALQGKSPDDKLSVYYWITP